MAVVAVSRKKHADLRVSSSNNFLHSFKDRPSLPLYGFEIGRLAGDYPLFFSPTEDTYGISMMCAIDPSLGSVCMAENGDWAGLYVPAFLRQQPFSVLLNSEDDQQCVVCIDDESAALGEAGKALFDEGEPTEYLNHVTQFVRKLYEEGKQTRLVIQAIQEADLIVPWEINVPRAEGETIKLTDKYRIDEGKLNTLEDRQWIDLKEIGALAIIYGQLFSQNNLDKLVAAHNSLNAHNQGGSNSSLDFLLDDDEKFSLNFDGI